MRMLKTLCLLTIVLMSITAIVSLYLQINHPFALRDIRLFVGSLMSPDLREPDPAINTVAALEQFIEEHLKSNDIPGAGVAIIADGQIAWGRAYGYANIETEKEATVHTPFMAASISKAVMAVALMHAAEHGTLDLDADINDYLTFTVANPHIANLNSGEGDQITLRHLATHTSGIVDRFWFVANSYSHGDPVIPLKEYLQDYLAPLGKNVDAKGSFHNRASGEGYDYSNIGSGLAGLVLEEATGVGLDEYTQIHIFEPLGMTNSYWFLDNFDSVDEVAVPYTFGNQMLNHYSYPSWPAATFRTSTHDLAKLLAAIMNGGELNGTRILKPETVEAMLEKQTFPGLTEEETGIFWNYSKSGLIGHSGGNHGATTMMYFNPETNIGAVILTNGNPPRAAVPTIDILHQISKSSEVIDMFPGIEKD